MAKPVWTDAQIIQQMDGGYHWSGNNLTYGFPAAASFFPYGERTGFSAFVATQKATATLVIKLWDDLIVPNFTLADNGASANIKFANTTTNIGYAQAYYPGNWSGAGTVWLNSSTYGANSGTNNLTNPTVGQWGFSTYIHETGHALGLDHPGNYNGGSPTYANDALFAQDSQQYTIMSYFDASDTGSDWVASNGKLYFAQTPMVKDIAVIQSIYGADLTTRAGNTIYGFHSNADVWLFDFTQNAHPVLCIYDASGNDTLDLSGWNTSSKINLAPGSFSSCDMMTNNISIAKSAWIENAIGGGGNDTIIGNILHNVLDGRGGSDTLTGSSGHDTFVYSLAYGADIITDFVTTGAEADLIDLSGLQSIVSLSQLLGFATQWGANTIMTFSSGNTLTLQNVALNNLIAGDFLFYLGSTPPADENLAPTDIDLSKSSILENTPGGVVGNVLVADPDGDNVFTFGVSDSRFEVARVGAQYQLKLVNGVSLDYETESSINLTITASDAGGLSDQVGFVITVIDRGGANIVGSSRSDTIDATHTPVSQGYVSNENDVIDGRSGNDTIHGLGGNDTIVGGLGTDTLYGDAGNDTLDGGVGGDRMIGGLGNDSYVVDKAADLVDETGGDGTDLVQSSIAFSLSNATYAKGSIENLTLTGNAAINGTGNALANVIVGNSGANILTGLAGADSLDGGAGIDTATYAASSAGVNVSLMMHTGSGGDAAGDTLFNIEKLIGSKFNDTLEGDGGANTLTGGNGIDTVSYKNAGGAVKVSLATTSAQNTLAAGTDTLSGFENLTGSQFNDTLIGTAGANAIIGGDGSDKITGAGGADILTGGLGADTFIFKAVGDSAPAAPDLIIDFMAGIDKIDLSLIDAKSSASGNQAFLYVDHNPGVAANSVAWYEDIIKGNTIVRADYNGNATADVQIVLHGINLGLHATDFIL